MLWEEPPVPGQAILDILQEEQERMLGEPRSARPRHSEAKPKEDRLPGRDEGLSQLLGRRRQRKRH